MKRFIVVIAMLLGLARVASADDKATHLFRYYDANHKMHLDQQISDDALTYGYDEVNSNLEVIRTVAPRPTAKDLERIRAEQARRDQEQAQAQQDAVLKRMYSSPQDAIRDRDSQIDAIQLRIDFSNSSIIRLRALRAQDAERAAGFERNGNPVPKDLQDSIQKYDAQIATAQDDIKARRVEQDAVRAQFAATIKRLKDIQAAASADGASSGPAAP